MVAVAEESQNDEFIDVDWGNLRILGIGRTFGLWHLPADFPDFHDSCEVDGQAGAG